MSTPASVENSSVRSVGTEEVSIPLGEPTSATEDSSFHTGDTGLSLSSDESELPPPLPAPSQEMTRQLSPSSEPSSTQKCFATVPANVFGGMPFQVDVGGQKFNVICPENAEPGQQIEIELPTALSGNGAGSKNTTTVPTGGPTDVEKRVRMEAEYGRRGHSFW